MVSDVNRRHVGTFLSGERTSTGVTVVFLTLASVAAMNVPAIDSSEQPARVAGRDGTVTNLAPHIAALADNQFVSIGGQAVRRGDVARMEIIRAGERALPQLKRALQDQGPLVRAKILSILALLGIREETPLDVLSTLASALSDEEALVRQAAAGGLGDICLYLRSKGQHEMLEQASLDLAHALKDEAREVRMPCAIFLIRCGKRKLVPKSIRKEVEELDGLDLPDPTDD